MKTRLIIGFVLVGCFLRSSAQENLSVMDAVSIGLENNYSIIIEKNNAEIAGNNNSIGNAGFLPTIDVNATQNYNISTTDSRFLTGTEKNVSNAKGKNFNAGIALDWTLFDGFSMFVNKDMFEVLESMGQIQSRITIENTVSSIILTYFGIVQEKKLVQALREATKLSNDRKRIADAKISIGSGSKLMLLQSTVDLNADSTKLMQELTTLKNLKADLNVLMGRMPDILFEVVDTINLTNRLSYNDLVSKAQNQNSELQLARRNRELSVLGIRSAQSDRFPKLDLLAGYSFVRSTSEAGFLEYNRAFGPSYGLTLSYKLFDGFNTKRNIENAKIEASSSDVMFRQADLGLRADLYKKYNEYLLNLNIVALERTNKAVAKENVEVALEKYKLGSISDIDLREIQNKYVDSQYQLALAEFSAKQAEIELLRMSGDLYDSIGK